MCGVEEKIRTVLQTFFQKKKDIEKPSKKSIHHKKKTKKKKKKTFNFFKRCFQFKKNRKRTERVFFLFH